MKTVEEVKLRLKVYSGPDLAGKRSQFDDGYVQALRWVLSDLRTPLEAKVFGDKPE